jgi:hypothetical protein
MYSRHRVVTETSTSASRTTQTWTRDKPSSGRTGHLRVRRELAATLCVTIPRATPDLTEVDSRTIRSLSASYLTRKPLTRHFEALPTYCI